MIYNIVLNSNNNVGGTNYSNYTYNFDWSNLEEGSYELTFNFSASLTNVSETLIVSCPDLGVCSHSFTTTSLTAQRFNGVIGVITPTIGTINPGNDDFFVPYTYNPPVFLKTRPFSNQFTIYLHNNSGSLIDLENEYILILSLKKL